MYCVWRILRFSHLHHLVTQILNDLFCYILMYDVHDCTFTMYISQVGLYHKL